MAYLPDNQRYDKMIYNRCGDSGLKLPAISLGLWHNFGGINDFENSRALVRRAFDIGITHFDLANNYGPPPGSAEETFGCILKKDFERYRDEMVISTKAGYVMWPGPYGNWGSKKYIISSLNQSLKRMGLDYVDIFYHHRPDPDTPIEETMEALDLIVRQGKALYVGISNYNAEQTQKALSVLKDMKTPFIIHQARYSMMERGIEKELIPLLNSEKIGLIVFKPLYQGILSNKYLSGIPQDSRAAGPSAFLKKEDITEEIIEKVKKLNSIAQRRGQTMSQMALSWVLRDGHVTSALIGASRVSQIEENVAALQNTSFSGEELAEIDSILK